MAACAWYTLIWVPVLCQHFGTAALNPHVQWAFMVFCPAAALGVVCLLSSLKHSSIPR